MERMVIRVFKTIEQIHIEYDGQWVYLINLRMNERGTVTGGEVAYHSESRDKVVMSINPMDGIFVFYAGKIPAEVSIIL